MHNLQAVASSSLSLPADSYIYGITAAAPGTFAAISSDDSLRVFDAADLNRGAVVSSHTHDGGVTSLRSYAGESQLLTGGRDGKVRIWDVRAGGPVVEMETGESMFLFYVSSPMFPVLLFYCTCLLFPFGYLLGEFCSKDIPVSIKFWRSIRCILTNACLARHSPVLSVACNPETNTVVAGTELVSSQAVVAFWYVFILVLSK
jgi:WD40 repeat protein